MFTNSIQFREEHSQLYNNKNTNLKQSLNNLYLNDINRIHQLRQQEKFQQLEEDRKELERINKFNEQDRLIKLNILEQRRKEFQKDYKESIKHQSNNPLIRSKMKESEINFYKPNELIYEPVNPYIPNTKSTIYSSNSNRLGSNLIATPYNGGLESTNIYSIHKDNEYGSNGFSPNNFFIDNAKSNKDLNIFSKKRTYHNSINNDRYTNEDNTNENTNSVVYTNIQSGPSVYSEVS